eukprot:m.161923 g.161923  ORF g.161923 m.161923 type:complete len:486 (+) comp12125_c0_seq1:236-1693(+)
MDDVNESYMTDAGNVTGEFGDVPVGSFSLGVTVVVTVLSTLVAAAYWFQADIAKWGRRLLCQNFLSMLTKSIKIGTIDLDLPSFGTVRVGEPNVAPGGLSCTMVVHDVAAIWRIVLQNDIGFATGYCDGLWTTNNLSALIAIIAANREAGSLDDSGTVVSLVSQLVLYLVHLARANTLKQSQVNIERHYDLGNDMYKTFLDPTMTYSSAYFTKGLDLQQAQLAKYDRLISEAQIGPNDRVIDVGCGWGGFAIRAASTTGCSVVGITLSKEQLAYAQEKVAELGLSDRITLLLLDYRLAAKQFKGQFDHAVSIEMIEAVGVEYLPTYFQALHDFIKPSGSIMIQAISMVEARYAEYCRSTDFIQQYIFPGGHCPSLNAITSAAGGAGLTVHGVEESSLHYAETLRQWDQKFMASRARLLELGYDDRFINMWHYYFCYCEVGFAARLLSLYQIRLTKPFAIERPDVYIDNPVFNVPRYTSQAIPQQA